MRFILADLQTRSGGYIRVCLSGEVFFFPPVKEGVKNQLWAGTAKGAESWVYYEPVGVGGVRDLKVG